MTHTFALTAEFRGGLCGVGSLAAGGLKSVISAPATLGGSGRGTNPEELLLGAAASCYLITLAAIAERRGLPVAYLEVSTSGEVSVEGGLALRHVAHRARIWLDTRASDAELASAEQAGERAEEACMIARALRGNVMVSAQVEALRVAPDAAAGEFPNQERSGP
jgi:peroxiredoxin-like protein